MHIGYLVQQFPPEVGAEPAWVSEMGRHWLDAGRSLTVYTAMPHRPRRVMRASGGGVVAAPGNSSAIADAVQSLAATSQPTRAAMGAAGRTYVSRTFDRGALASKYLGALEAATREGRRSRSR